MEYPAGKFNDPGWKAMTIYVLRNERTDGFFVEIILISVMLEQKVVALMIKRRAVVD